MITRYGGSVPHKRVIAVFGPTPRKEKDPKSPNYGKVIPVSREILRCARFAGALIGEKHILLTGGAGPGDDSVKDTAIAGAREAEGAWVGVLQGDEAPPDGGAQSPRHHVIPTGLRHRRNFLEALMCDAAIAFVGGPGTRSEVACAFALQRPVALVGQDWRKLLNPELFEQAYAYLTEKPAPDASFEACISKCLDPTHVACLLRGTQDAAERPYKYFDPPREGERIADIVDWAATVPGPTGAPAREFPEVDAIKAQRGPYLAWLDTIEEGG